MPGVQTVTVAEDEADSRIDRWLRRRFPQLTQGRIERMLRKGELRVDGARAKASTAPPTLERDTCPGRQLRAGAPLTNVMQPPSTTCSVP